jgi:hypothetical protein
MAALSSAAILEMEPNNAVGNANHVALGNMVQGVLNPGGDVDVFAIDVSAGARLDLNVDAHVVGSPLDATLRLINVNGQTVLASSEHDTYEPDGSLDPRIRYTTTSSGRYFVEVTSAGGSGGPNHAYSLILAIYAPPAPGPGDPVALFASGFNYPQDMAAAANGDLFVTDLTNGGRVSRVTPSAQVSTLAGNVSPTWGLATDGFGNVLVPACEYPNGVIWRIAPGGERTRFFSGPGTPAAITVGPDGDVWVSDNQSGQLWRFDAQGVRKATHPVPEHIIGDLAFSPAGELHFSAGAGLYKLAGNTPQLVAAQSSLDYWRWQFARLAFDVDGYLYVSAGDKVLLYTPQYQVVNNPFALGGDRYGITRIRDLVFARDAGGATTRRLFMAQTVTAPQPPFGRTEGVYELNPAAIRAQGWPIGPLIAIHPPTLHPATVGVDYVAALSTQGTLGPVSWSIAVGALPPGLVLGEPTGMITGVPLSTGLFTFTVRAVNGIRDAHQQYTLSVGGELLPVELTEKTAVVDSVYEDTLRMPNAPGPVIWSLVAGTLPPGVLLGEHTGILAGVPTDTGAFTFEVRGRSGSSVGQGNFTISVSGDGLQIDRSPLSPAFVDLQYADTLRMEGGSGKMFWAVRAGDLPPGIKLNKDNGILSGVPTASGSFTFDVLAVRGFRWGTARFTLEVSRPDVSVDDAVEAVLGGGALTPELRHYLDAQGNKNGTLDIGDVRAFLRRQEQAQNASARRSP